MPDLIMRKVSTGLVVSDDECQETLRRIKNGDFVTVTVRRPRNLAWHRRYMALITATWECGLSDRFPRADNLREAILLRLGFCRSQISLDGEVTLIADSMAFSKMDQGRFEEVWDRTCSLIETEVLPGLDARKLAAEANTVARVYDLMGVERRAA